MEPTTFKLFQNRSPVLGTNHSNSKYCVLAAGLQRSVGRRNSTRVDEGRKGCSIISRDKHEGTNRTLWGGGEEGLLRTYCVTLDLGFG